MLDNSRMLENRTIQSMETIPESIGYDGEVVVPATTSSGGSGNSTGLPAHPRIDSGFVVTLNDGVQNEQRRGGGRGGGGTHAVDTAAPKFKIGIEMQVRDQGNMDARVVDYGTRIFKYKKNEGYVKTYELALVRWGVQHNANTILAPWGMPGSVCDATAPANFVNGIPLCCAQLFLGTAVNVMDVVLRTLNNRHRNEENWTLNDGDRTAVRNAIFREKNAQRNTLIDQMRRFFNKGNDNFNNWSDKEKDCVNRIGFFKYGHLMSAQDVQNLGDQNLKDDYECMKIKEDNIVNNISDIEAIYGKVSGHDLTIFNQLAQKDNEIAQKDNEIARLKRQLGVAKNQKGIQKLHKKEKETRLEERTVEKSKLKNSKSNGNGKSIKTTPERKRKSYSFSPSASESSSDNSSKKTNGRRKGK
jgi:hypothetical protein